MPIQTRQPTSDTSTSGTWTGTAGSRYTLVDDFPDDATDFVRNSASPFGASIVFGFTAFDLPSNATNIVLRLKYYDRDETSGVNSIAGRLNWSGTSRNATSHDPSLTVTLRTDTFSNNPLTGTAWTPDVLNRTAGINSLTGIGFSLADANPGIRIYSLEAEVEYSVPTGRSFGFIIG